MGFLQNLPLVWNILIFVVAAAVVWAAGVRLSRYADKLIDKTGVSDVFVGSIGLAVITSLPEVATTISATLANNAGMAINNLFGSIALQVTVLVVADAYIKKTSLSGLLESPVARLQATCLVFLLAVAAISIMHNDVAIFHIGVWSVTLFLLYVGASYMVNYFKGLKWWITEPRERESIGEVKAIVREHERKQHDGADRKADDEPEIPLSTALWSSLGLSVLIAAVFVLVGGYFVANSADVISQKTGIGSNFMGFFFVGITTSLPELSTTISAVKLQRPRMAFSNIFGTNLLNVGMVFLADVFYFNGPVLNEVGTFSAAAALLGIVLTSVYLMGLTIQLKRAFFNLGVDSILIVLFYIAGSIILLTIK